MNRREFLKLFTTAAAVLAVPGTLRPARDNTVWAGGLGVEEPVFRPIAQPGSLSVPAKRWVELFRLHLPKSVDIVIQRSIVEDDQ